MKKPRVSKRPVSEVSPGNDPLDSDAAAFESAMRDVARLEPDVRGRVGGAARGRGLSAARPMPVEAVEESVAATFVAPGVDRRELKKLRRGDYVADSRTDLHGMTAVNACERVRRLIENGRHRGYRCICIVHGRGLHSEAGVAVLKTRVRAFLRTDRSVLAYSDAPSSDGGAGAVYVLLRK